MRTSVRKFVDADYSMMFQWWREHDSFSPRPEHLSPYGIIIEIGEEPICCGFMYNTDSKICVFEFVVCNPEADKMDRDEALGLMIDQAILWSRDRGYKLIYTSIGIQKYIQRLEKKGFVRADINQTHMFREV